MSLVRHGRAPFFGALLWMLLFLAPADAQASTAFANVSRDEGDYFGPVTFAAARGEKNQVTVARGGLGIVFRDVGSRLRDRHLVRAVDARWGLTELERRQGLTSWGFRTPRSSAMSTGR